MSAELPDGRRPPLITVPGVRSDATTYRLGDRTITAPLSAVALARLLDEPPEAVLAICTAEAEATFRVLERELADAAGLEPLETKMLRVPSVDSEEAALRLVDDLGHRLADGRPIIVDLTHGPRHLAFLAFATTLLAAALGNTDIRGVYYSCAESVKLVDLRSLVRVLDVIHAARIYKETGSARTLAGFLESVTSRESESLRRLLRRASLARLAGLPLELGKWASELGSRRRSLKRVLTQAGLPLADSIATTVVDALDGVQLSVVGEGWKRKLRLDGTELARQRKVIDDRLALGDTSTAVLMMEEWLVSWALWQGGRENGWLDTSPRKQATDRLHHLRLLLQRDKTRLTEDQQRVARLWGALSEARNAFAHAGMQGGEIDLESSQLRRAIDLVLDGWSWLAGAQGVELSTAGPSPLMVSPLGQLPGALYTALRKCREVERCVVVCSPESRNHLPTVARALGRSPKAFVELVLEDPLGGADEVDGLVKIAEPHLLDASEVYVHLTGGSTLMGYVCHRIGECAERLDRPVHHFLTLDRRNRTEQERDPFVEGELVELSKRERDQRGERR